MTQCGGMIKLGVMLCLLGIVWGCGKKAPPVPPGVPPLSPVKHVTHRLDGTRMILSWTAPSGKGTEHLAGYNVLRSVTRPGDDLCEGCPILFTRITQLGPTHTRYEETVVPGWTYLFKVVGYTPYKAQSPDSSLIRFTVPTPDEDGDTP